MIYSPLALKELLVQVQEATPSISKNVVLVKSEELVKFVSEYSSNQDIIIAAILADGNAKGNNNDSIVWKNQIEFWVVEKTDYSSFENNLEWLKVWERTAKALGDVVRFLNNESIDNCNLSGVRLYEGNFFPIYHFAECNGYGVELSFDL